MEEQEQSIAEIVKGSLKESLQELTNAMGPAAMCSAKIAAPTYKSCHVREMRGGFIVEGIGYGPIGGEATICPTLDDVFAELRAIFEKKE
jgi:hypothetical protein